MLCLTAEVRDVTDKLSIQPNEVGSEALTALTALTLHPSTRPRIINSKLPSAMHLSVFETRKIAASKRQFNILS